MSLWSDIRADVVELTKRPDLIADTDIAIRLAIRNAHKSGRFWRDLQSSTIGPLSTATEVQSANIVDFTTRFRQAALVQSGTRPDVHLEVVTIEGLLDWEGYPKKNICWAAGTALNIRALNPEATYKFTYYQYPVISPQDSMNSWIADQHQELISLWAAMTVLNAVNEQEIVGRLEKLALEAYSQLKKDSIEFEGR